VLVKSKANTCCLLVGVAIWRRCSTEHPADFFPSWRVAKTAFKRPLILNRLSTRSRGCYLPVFAVCAKNAFRPAGFVLRNWIKVHYGLAGWRQRKIDLVLTTRRICVRTIIDDNFIRCRFFGRGSRFCCDAVFGALFRQCHPMYCLFHKRAFHKSKWNVSSRETDASEGNCWRVILAIHIFCDNNYFRLG